MDDSATHDVNGSGRLDSGQLKNADVGRGIRYAALAASVVFVLGLVVRLIYLWESADNPTFFVPIVDAAQYDRLARGWAAGHGLDPGFFWQPFFYPAFLSLIYWVSGSSILAAKVVQAVVGAATCGVTYLLGRQVFSHRAGLIAGLIAAFYGPLIFFDGELVGTGWACFWAVSMTLLMIRATDRPTVGAMFVLGLCGGLGVVTRPPLLPFFVVGCFWLVFRRLRRSAESIGLWPSVPVGLLGFGLIAMPVAAVQHHVMKRFSFMPNSGGINFYIGNNADRCETLQLRPGPDWEWLTREPEREGAPGQEAGSAYFFEKVASYARNSPSDFAVGLLEKMWQFWNSRELPRNVDMYLFREWSVILRALMWKVGPFGFPFGVLFPLALIGVVTNVHRIPAPIYFALVFYSAAIALVFVSGRYRVVIVPVLAVLAGQGLVEMVGMFKQGKWSRLVVMSGIGLMAAALSSWPSTICVEGESFAAEMRGYLGSELSRRGRTAEAAAALGEALRMDPESASVQFNLGSLLRRRGESDQAMVHLNAALEKKPYYRKARKALGEMLIAQGQKAQAATLFEEGIRIDATDPDSHRGLASVLTEQGRLEEAADHYTESLRFDRRSAETFIALARVLTELGQVEAAIAWLYEGIEFHPRNEALYPQIGELYADSGNPSEAVRMYRRALALRNDWWEVVDRLAWLLATSEEDRVRDGEEAIRLASAACKATVYGQAEYLDTLSAANAEAGRFGEAIRIAERALARALATGNDALAERIRDRTVLYRKGEPFRQKKETE